MNKIIPYAGIEPIMQYIWVHNLLNQEYLEQRVNSNWFMIFYNSMHLFRESILSISKLHHNGNWKKKKKNVQIDSHTGANLELGVSIKDKKFLKWSWWCLLTQLECKFTNNRSRLANNLVTVLKISYKIFLTVASRPKGTGKRFIGTISIATPK